MAFSGVRSARAKLCGKLVHESIDRDWRAANIACCFSFGLRLLALNNYQFRVRRGLAKRFRLGVFWRRPPLSRPLHARKLADDQPFASPLSLENVNRTAGNESPTVFLYRRQQHPFIILEPNRIFDRKTRNDID